jgi:hypothetical protein
MPSTREEVAPEGTVAQRVGRWPSTARSHVASRRDTRATPEGAAVGSASRPRVGGRCCACRAVLASGDLTTRSVAVAIWRAPGGRSHEHNCRWEEGRPLCAFGVERCRRRAVDLQSLSADVDVTEPGGAAPGNGVGLAAGGAVPRGYAPRRPPSLVLVVSVLLFLFSTYM